MKKTKDVYLSSYLLEFNDDINITFYIFKGISHDLKCLSAMERTWKV
jgi:hypothetical protein